MNDLTISSLTPQFQVLASECERLRGMLDRLSTDTPDKYMGALKKLDDLTNQLETVQESCKNLRDKL